MTPVVKYARGVGIEARSVQDPIPLGADTTVTVAEPEMLPLVARTTEIPGDEPAVKSPALVMVPLPVLTDHVGVIETVFPWASFPTAANCRVPEVATVSLAGATAMLAGVPSPPDTSVGGTLCLPQWRENIAAAVAPATTRQTALRIEGDMVVRTLHDPARLSVFFEQTWS